jgi:hypothetical protein
MIESVLTEVKKESAKQSLSITASLVAVTTAGEGAAIWRRQTPTI